MYIPLDKIFELAFELKLKTNKLPFEENCLTLTDHLLNSPFRTALDSLSRQFIPYRLDPDTVKESIRKTLSLSSNPTFRKRTIESERFSDNEIAFNIIQDPWPEWGTPELNSHRVGCENLEFQCENEFWQLKENLINFQSLDDFNCFEDVLVKQPLLGKTLYGGYKYNLTGWTNYICRLLVHFFYDFKLDEKSKSSSDIVFTKEIGEGFSLSIVFDKQLFHMELKHGDLALAPLKLRLHCKAEPSENPSSVGESSLELGILGNPFFYEPCSPLLGYAAVAMYHDPDVPDSMNPNYFKEYQDLGNGFYKISHSEVYGEQLKKHAYFYLAALRYTSTGYLDFIIKSIKDATHYLQCTPHNPPPTNTS